MPYCKHRVRYRVASGKQQARNVELEDGKGDPKTDAGVVRDILAAEHKVRPDQISLLFPGEKKKEKPKGPSVRDIEAMSKAELLDLVETKELKVDVDQNVGPLKESIAKALGLKK